MMIRILGLTLVLLLLGVSSASAQVYQANIQLTIDATAGGVGFTASDINIATTHPQVNSAACISNPSGGDFRYRTDSGAPTTTLGNIVPAGGAIIFNSTESLLAFKGIRTASTSAVLNCTFSNLQTPPVYPVGAGGSSGSFSGDTELPTAATLADDTANPSLPAVAAYMMAFDGTTWDRARLASDMTIGTALGTSGPGIVCSYKDFDGSALPTTSGVGTEEEANPCANSVVGVQYIMPVTENGAATSIHVDEAAFTYAASGLFAIGAVAESTTDTLADGTIGVPVMTLARGLRTVPTGYLGGGGTPINMLSDASDNEDETAICTGPCTVYSIIAFNHTAASAFLRCENDTAANTTPGSETASANEFDLEIPASTTGAGFAYNVGGGIGASFDTALTCWIVSDEASSGTTDVAANDVRVQFVRVQ